MNNAKAVWERYVGAWNAEASTDKRALFAECLAPGCVYRDPLTEAKGWDELHEAMTGFQQQMPGTTFVTEYFLAHHGRSIARWKMLSAAGAVLGVGISYGEYDTDERLVAMNVFFDTPEAAAA